MDRASSPTSGSTLGLDETAFSRMAPYYRTAFVTSIVDVTRGQLLDLVPGKGGDEPKRWIMDQGQPWRDGVAWATLDLSGAYKAVFDACLPHATQVADKFHVIKLANERVDETRRRVQNETLGHRGRKDDPLYRARRVLTMAQQRLGPKGVNRHAIPWRFCQVIPSTDLHFLFS